MSARRAGTCCLGDRITLADMCLAPQLANARRFNCDVTPFPRLEEIADRAAALPAFAQVAPRTHPDAI